MDTSKIIILFRTLVTKTISFWNDIKIASKDLFDFVTPQIILQLNTFKSIILFLVRQTDKLIDTIANHPLLDKAGSIYNKYSFQLDQYINKQKLLFQQTNFFKKSALYAQLTRLDKPIGILLLLWPTLIALWIAAGGWPDPLVLFVFVIGVILMRSAGCAINDYADREVDGKVKRTRERPLASGKITEKETLIVFASLSTLAFILVLFMNTLTIIMSIIGVLLAISYPFMKRYHYLPQVHLGAAFGWSAPMAYAAQANEVNAVTWLIFLSTILWATAYDTMYAMVDYDDDIKIGVKSTAILFGNQDKLIIGAIQILLLLNLILIGHRAELSGFYYTGVAGATLFSIYQQYLIKDRKRELCFQAFLNNNYFGMILFIGVFLDYQFADVI